MPKMRCLHCGRWVLIDHSQRVNEARCICGTFVLESFKKEKVLDPKLILNDHKPKKIINIKSKSAAKLKNDKTIQNNYDPEECAA
jgi:hypothetical protein